MAVKKEISKMKRRTKITAQRMTDEERQQHLDRRCDELGKRNTTKTKDRTRTEATDELLKRVINEAKAFSRPAPLKSGSKKMETS
jgi:hypothetical protein